MSSFKFYTKVVEENNIQKKKKNFEKNKRSL